MFKFPLIFSLILLTEIVVPQKPAEDPTLREKMDDKLEASTNKADSAKILYNIFDRTPHANSTPVAMEILEYAKRNNDTELGLEMICQLGFLNITNDSILKYLQTELRNFPDSPHRRMASTYISLRRAGNATLYSDTPSRLAKIKKSISDGYFHENQDIYDQIRNLGTVCMLMGSSTTAHRGLVLKYVEELLDLVKDLPETDLYLQNLVYNYASTMYSNLNMHKEAIEMCRVRLKHFAKLTNKFHNDGREYYNFDYHYYITYRLMLQNFRALSPEEIDDVHEKILRLVEKNVDVRNDYNKGICTAEAYYAIAKEDYAKALPLLQYVYETNPNQVISSHALYEIITAAEKVGDQQQAFDAAKKYIEQLTDYVVNDAQQTYTEMQILYDINDLRAKNSMLQIEQATQSLKNQQKLNIIFIIAAIGLVIVLLLGARAFQKNKRLANMLKASNEALKQEGEVLRKAQENLIQARDKAAAAERHKTEFIDNISHEIITPAEALVEYSQLIVDCMDASKQKYLQRYADIVRLNAELFMNIVKDIFDIGELEEATIKVKPKPISIREMCTLAVDAGRKRLQPGVKLIFNERSDADTLIVTDGKRVEQVLINLITNATKFTSEGTISLDYRIDRNSNTVEFSVSDTGIGIPLDKSEEIFKRFVKLDKDSQGIGLGLPICRMIAELLHGTVELDTTFTRGSRFVFTIPIS